MENLNDRLKELGVIHLAITGGLILVLSVFYFIARSEGNDISFDISSLGGVAIAVSLGINGLYQLYYRRRLGQIVLQKSREAQLDQYRVLQIFRFACLEIAGLLCGLVYFFEHNLLFILIGFVFALVLMSYKPTQYRVESELGPRNES